MQKWKWIVLFNADRGKLIIANNWTRNELDKNGKITMVNWHSLLFFHAGEQ